MQYDLIVIGGGSGGISVAQRAAEYGKKCLVIESRKIGGTCVNVGCVPKKIMWLAGNIANTINDSRGFGFNVNANNFSWERLKAGRDKYIKSLNNWYKNNLQDLKIDYVEGIGSLINKNSVKVDDKVYTAQYIILASGSKPIIDYNIKGAKLGINSDSFFELEKLPQKVAVLGGGYIAVELAGILNALGSEVQMFVRSKSILSNFDDMLSDNLLNSYKDKGIVIHTNTNVKELNKDSIKTDKGDFDGFDLFIWAIGRQPLIDNLNLSNIGIILTDKDFIKVDKLQKTNIDNIYAIGDVIGKVSLAPVAVAAGRKLADRLFNNMNDYLNYNNIASVVFSYPPIATVGLSEQQALKKFNDIKIYTSNFIPMSDALVEQQSNVCIKLICQGVDEKIIGCHIIGENSDEIMQGFSVAITMGASKKDFDKTMAIHPTISEEIVTMR